MAPTAAHSASTDVWLTFGITVIGCSAGGLPLTAGSLSGWTTQTTFRLLRSPPWTRRRKSPGEAGSLAPRGWFQRAPTASSGRSLSSVWTPNWLSTEGAREEKQGHHESVPPPQSPRPSLLSLLLHPLPHPLIHTRWLSYYIPGALFFAGKHSSAAGREVELFSVINGSSAESQLPEGSG